MLQLILVIAIGVAAGWTVGRLMSATVRPTGLDLVVGALGALAAISAARWGGMTDVDLPAQTIALSLLGSLLATFVVALARQARQPGEWVAERRHAEAFGLASASPHAGSLAGPQPSLAGAVSRDQPLLVLHAGHAMRCWPEDGLPSARGDGETARLDWIVEVDGQHAHRGPSWSTSSTRAEVTAGVREWWDELELSTAVARLERESARLPGTGA